MPASAGCPVVTFQTVWYRHPATRYQPGRSMVAARASTSLSVWFSRSATRNRSSCSSTGSWPAFTTCSYPLRPDPAGPAALAHQLPEPLHLRIRLVGECLQEVIRQVVVRPFAGVLAGGASLL